MTMNTFKIFCPVKPIGVNQPFGVNGDYYRSHGINIAGHNGVDLAAAHGQPVYAAHDGTAFYEIDEDQGDGFVIITDKPFDYNGSQVYFKTIYWHLVSRDDGACHPVIKTDGSGQHVVAGQLIGFADSTGLSSGNHLHFGLKPVAMSEPPQSWYNVQQNNGYLGAIDPSPFLNGQFAEDLPIAKYPFNVGIEYGDTSRDVNMLQYKLKALGFFPSDRMPTAYYGDTTAKAVLAFQLKHSVDSVGNLNGLRGRVVGPRTRAALNNQ